MPSPLLRLALCCILSLTLGSASVLAEPQSSTSGDKDLAEVEHYTLTMNKVTRYAATFGDLQSLAKAHPELKNSLAGSSDDSLDALEHRIASQPAVVAALTRNGFSPREFVVFGLALFQSAFAEATAKQNGVDPAKAAAEAHVNPANIAFVTQHKAELEAVMTKMKESAKEEPGKDSSEN